MQAWFGEANERMDRKALPWLRLALIAGMVGVTATAREPDGTVEFVVVGDAIPAPLGAAKGDAAPRTCIDRGAGRRELRALPRDNRSGGALFRQCRSRRSMALGVD